MSLGIPVLGAPSPPPDPAGKGENLAVRVADFDFHLPPEAIAQRPVRRGTARLMALEKATGAVSHRFVSDLPHLLRPGDLLVLNDTKVLPARLFGVDEEGRRTKFLLTTPPPVTPSTLDCLAHPGRRVRPGRLFAFGDGLLARVLEKTPGGQYRLAFEGADLESELPRLGTAPLPPYIHRPGGMADERDREDYQTVFARAPGAIAAPTAGLHFTPELLGALHDHGIATVTITLHVGLGTFRPVKAVELEEHRMDPERGEIPEEAAREIARARAEGRRIVAVGTTSVRTLESSAREHGGEVVAGPFETRLFLHPGEEFRVVEALMTNFHLPRATLLMLVSALAGREKVLAAYAEAVRCGYRFFSYGDAMLIQ